MSKKLIESIRENALNNIAAECENQKEYINKHLDELETCQVEIVWDLVKKYVEVNV